ncbi:hypothetical protein [Oceanobacillus jordanicus]|uniref:Competence protein ComG n=1 Tax=Oceanobacillus jordanicus TaxID=2867266 RepID=A0AAW5B4V1_9BACI|nr:hypothetical protein [Oceanobacillus jordanicus]MCG3418710.1 hypothetical protein [Oceanobacillus jordanicus]
MKRRSYGTMTNERGFILPYVLVVLSIIFLLLFHGTAGYRNELHMTDMQMEQTRIETLFQSSRQLLIEEIKVTGNVTDHASYHFPHGEVFINIERINEATCLLAFTIRTKGNDVKNIESPLVLSGLLD